MCISSVPPGLDGDHKEDATHCLMWQRHPYLVSIEDLGDAAVGDPQLARDDAGPDAGRRHLHDLQPDVVRQGPPVDEHPSQLVHTTLTYGKKAYYR